MEFRKIVLKKQAEEDILYFKKINLKKVERIKQLLRDIQESPFSGIGKPEPLRHDLAGCWSRRIDQEHRLVYRVGQKAIEILQCRYHY